MIDKLSKKFRKFVRRRKLVKGHDGRVESWSEICPRLFGAVEYEARKLLYGQLCETLSLEREDSHTEDFVYYTVHSDTKLMQSGKETLNRLLTAVRNTPYHNANINDEILSAIASILLNAMSEDEVFASVTMLIESEMHKKCFTMEKDGDKLLIAYLHRDKVLRNFFVKNENFQTADVLQGWIEWLFLDLPHSHVTCLVDVFLHDGIDSLYRIVIVVLGLWLRNRNANNASNNVCNINQEISNFCIRLNIQPAELIKLAYSKKHKKSKEETDDCSVDQKGSNKSIISESSWEEQPQTSCFLNSSNILTENQMADLYLKVPVRYQLHEVKRIFSMHHHGISLSNFWHMIEQASPTIFIVQTTKDEIFGAFCTQAWVDRKKWKKLKYFGTGESFVFKISAQNLFTYNWVGLEPTSHKLNQELFQAADENSLIVGGGAISIRHSLLQGCTEASATYLNPPLATNSDFEIRNLEVFGFC